MAAAAITGTAARTITAAAAKDEGAPEGAPFSAAGICGNFHRLVGTVYRQERRVEKHPYFVRPQRENNSLVLADICGHTREFAEITVEKDKEKLKIMLDFLLG